MTADHPKRTERAPGEVADYADKIMAEIDSDIASGRVPATVASFSELHEYVDANDYALQVIPQAAAPNWDAWMELANHVETEVTERLAHRTPCLNREEITYG